MARRRGQVVRLEFPRLLTAAQAAELLTCDPSTVRRMVASGRLPGVRIGGSGGEIRIAEEDVRRYVESQRAATPLPPPPPMPPTPGGPAQPDIAAHDWRAARPARSRRG